MPLENLSRRIDLRSEIVNSNWLSEGGYRLGAGYHCNDGQVSARRIAKSNSKVEKLLDLCHKLFIPSRFKRPYVESGEHGYRYITGSGMLLSDPSDEETFLSKKITPNVSELMLNKDMIIISCSGIIGRCVLVNGDLNGCIGSPDLIRAIVNTNRIKAGYLYAYLSSRVGQSLAQMQIYGSVIDHIEAQHIYDLPVPRLSLEIETKIASMIEKAWAYREKANEIIRETKKDFSQSLGLEPIGEQPTKNSKASRSFIISSDNLKLRLDATHYDPPGIKAAKIIRSRNDYSILGEVTEKIFHPFRMSMILVNSDHGVPFLGGGDISQFKYWGDKFISPLTENYEDYLLKKGWTLLTIGGTIGYVSYVSDYLNGWAASQHVTRIVPIQERLLPGYLYTFMKTEYAQSQIMNLIYGSVVDTIRESQLETILIPLGNQKIQQKIHNKVDQAFRLRDDANALEHDAQEELLKEINL